MNRVLTGIVVIMFFMWVGVLNAEQKEIIGKDGAFMVLIPAGEFLMGSPQGKGYDGSQPGEHPQHSVFLSAYYIDKYEVTVARYRVFCQATGRSMPSTPSWGWQDNHPIVDVSWEDAAAYAQYHGKRLPTEAEWEKACRAGSTTRYCFGDAETDLKDYAWYRDDSDFQTHPVGTKKPNAFGLYDMHGNVWEWCSDWYDENYYSNSPVNNPKGPASGQTHVEHGGGYGFGAVTCRSANRYRMRAKEYYIEGGDGFRCVSLLGISTREGLPSDQIQGSPGQDSVSTSEGATWVESESGFSNRWYLTLLSRRLNERWNPVREGSATVLREVTVSFTITRDGRIKDVGLTSASGNPRFDRSGLTAVVESDFLPPLPASWREKELKISVRFRDKEK